MPVILLLIGLIIAVIGFVYLAKHATAHQLRMVLNIIGAAVLAIALTVLALTGRIWHATAIVAVVLPFVIAHYVGRSGHRSARTKTSSPPGVHSTELTRKQAREILGLDENADDEAVKHAYRHLMSRLHPDHGGTDWMAERLNAARARLLGDRDA
jgi:Ca2+/Na+ antiporter